MKTLCIFAFCLLPSALAAAAPLLDRIARVESGNRHHAIGDGGRARGAWQMHKSAWDDTSARRRAAGLPTFPFASGSRDPATARAYAQNHLELLRTSLIRAGLPQIISRKKMRISDTDLGIVI